MKNPCNLLYMMFLFLIIELLSSCQSGKGPAAVAFSLEEKDLIPEGITYDPVTRQFFVSSINKEKIVSISEDGKVSDFIKTGQDSIMETLGMKIDADARRLWVVSNKTINEVNFSAVHIFNIDTKELLRKIIVRDTAPQLFNDLVLNKMGDVYITDSYGSKILRVDAGMEKLELFAGPDSLLRWVNGIAVSPDGKTLYPASGAYITTIDIESKVIRPIGDPNQIGSKGIDGIVFYKGSLVGIINEKKTENEMFIASYKLSSDLKSISAVKIIDKGNPLFNLPTTCVLADDNLYCLGSTSLRLFFQDKTNEKNLFMNPLILKYKLDN
jgi:DNA-binding beta-propeller fold protein YncE